MHVRYQACTATGKLVQGDLAVETVAEAVTELHNQGLFVVNIEAVRKTRQRTPARWHPARRGVPLKTLVVFLRQFSSLFRAGLPLLACLNLLAREAASPVLRDACRSLRQEIARGRSLSQALKSQGRLFPPLLVHMTEAAEATGNLDEVYDRLAANYEREARLREKLGSAAAYPVFVLCLAVAVSLLMVRLVLPQFLSLLGDVQAALPAPTRLLLALGEPRRQLRLLLAGGILTALASILLATRRGSRWRDGRVLKLPLIGPLLLRAHLARFCRSLSLALRSGIPLVAALDLVKRTALNHVFVSELERIQAGIQRGGTLADLFAQSRIFPGPLVQMVRVGEEAGNLEEMLAEVGAFYERELDHYLAVLTAVAEPALILFVGGIVGFIVLALMLPLLSSLAMVT
ncbi:type II secretion system F family protein [Gelria sp. Kuro-4]|uniref:type II secretion system F family protein n=1 Tax=Gelria sp. Kuro-4 TaxID=2796927 RepID=UPI001BEEA2B6|nr:type II secretion system F family protein [Gelria sp. Kuro-4]BCV25058.1 type II secretion system protein [Gelria sp. Kuro-4]